MMKSIHLGFIFGVRQWSGRQEGYSRCHRVVRGFVDLVVVGEPRNRYYVGGLTGTLCLRMTLACWVPIQPLSGGHLTQPVREAGEAFGSGWTGVGSGNKRLVLLRSTY